MMRAMAKHAGSMELDGNLMVVLMTNAEQFGEIHVNRGIESRPSSSKDLYSTANVSREEHGSAGGACSSTLPFLCSCRPRQLVEAGRRQYPAWPAWDLQERGSFGSQLSS